MAKGLLIICGGIEATHGIARAREMGLHVVVSDGDRAAQTTPIADGFRDAGFFTEVIPLDRALRSGPIRYDQLGRATQDAWMRVAAAAARGF